MYRNEDEEDTDIRTAMVTRSHCEDRLACALALRSKEDFLYWWKAYVGRLVGEGDGVRLRFLVDMLLDRVTKDGDGSNDGGGKDLAVVVASGVGVGVLARYVQVVSFLVKFFTHGKLSVKFTSFITT